MTSSNNHILQETSSALIEQLVYFDNFMLNSETPNLELDGQLSLDLAAFADDSFIFAEENKPDPHGMSDFEGHEDKREESSRGEFAEERGDKSHMSDTGFKNVDIKEAAHPDNFDVNFHDQPSGTLPSNNDWYGKEITGEQHRRKESEGNQLHSLLNSKIEATKRNKFKSRLGHENFESSVRANAQFSGAHQQDSFGDVHRGETIVKQEKQEDQFLDVFAAHSQQGSSFSGNSGHSQAHQNPHQNSSQNLQTHVQNPHQNTSQNLSTHVQNPHQNPHQTHHQNHHIFNNESTQQPSKQGLIDFSKLPKYPVPPGAESSLKKAGLSQNQIDLLSALIAQHQTSLKNDIDMTRGSSNNTPIPKVPTLVSHNSTSSIHSEYTKESTLYSGSESGRFERNTATFSLNESPASNYSSEYSNGSTISVAKSSVKEEGSQTDEQGVDLTKRKRNTAASARFRIKKKLKEKEMETKISQLSHMISKFELRIGQLEMENKFLRNLIIEKGDRASDEELRLLKSKANYVDSKD